MSQLRARGRYSDCLNPTPHLSLQEDACRKSHPAFAMLYDYYKKPLGRYLLALVRDQEAVHDLYQETFIRAWKSISPNIESYFDQWLYRIARNLAFDYIRRNTAIKFLPLPESESDEPREYVLFGRLSVAGHEERVCDQLCFEQAFAAMSPKYKDCVMLQFNGGFNHQQIAEILDMSVSAVSSNITRGIKQLRDIYMKMMNDQDFARKGELIK